jgi:hypothetical protein
MAKLKVADNLADKVEKALTQKFVGAEVELERLNPGQRVSGALVWKGFAGKSQIERQTELRDAIDSSLDPEEQAKVSFILTLTPQERSALDEPQSN